MNTRTFNEIRMLDLPVHPLSLSESVNEILGYAETGQPHMVVTLNTFGFVLSQSDLEFRSVVQQASLVLPDGIGIVLGAKMLGFKPIERVAGVDLVQAVCEEVSVRQYKVFLLGARDDIVNLAAGRLASSYPGVRVCGVQHGYFREDEEIRIVDSIRNARPHILLVALGVPKQEKWIAKYLGQMNVPVCMGVGGSFDVLSGRVKRAPVFFQRTGLEWLFRVFQEPWRFSRLSCIPHFFLLLAGEILRRRKH